jgi:putative membrane protein
VFAAPVTLTLKTLPTHAARRIAAFLHSRPVWVVGHPLTSLLFNIGGMYLLYLTPLYAATLAHPSLHILVHIHFVIAGCLFTWAIAGPDPGPRRPGLRFRLGVLFLSMAAHATLAKSMYAYGWPRSTDHPSDQIQSAAQLMYYGGDLTELWLVIALFGLGYRGGNTAKLKHSLRNNPLKRAARL